MTEKIDKKTSWDELSEEEKRLGDMYVYVIGFRVLISCICALILIILWILAFALYDKGHFARSISLSALIAILAAIIAKKGILDVLLGKKLGTDKYSLGYQ